jgi:GT2 family glycosyltransferase
MRLIAFYLPQFHSIPENDNWWGKGFTEWRNVVKARPLFPGHYQPHLPADLGFYDLRLPEVREAQANLAREYGIHGFCYYHYWFNGRRVLERPFNEVLSSRKPDFPFCLCWANENWTKAWDGGNDEILLAQNYSHTDDLAHITSLIPAFRDERYIRVNGKPIFLVYRTTSLPNPYTTANIWREAAARAGIGEIYLVRVESFGERMDPTSIGFDASVEFSPHCGLGKQKYQKYLYQLLSRAGFISAAYREHKIFDYCHLVDSMLSIDESQYVRFDCVTPSWDNTPRRSKDALIVRGSTPALYETWLAEAAARTKIKFTADERLLFVNAWNEWGEGNHLEPDQKWGRAYLEATARIVGVSGCEEKPYAIANIPWLVQVDEEVCDPKVSVIILNWNGKEDTLECLRSLAKVNYKNFTVTVVDNGSIDGSVDAIQEAFPNMKLIETGQNLGYAGGNNVGIKQALSDDSDYVFILNNDTVVDSQVLQAFVDAATKFPDGGMFAAKIYYYSEPKKIWYAGGEWSRHLSDFRHIGSGFVDNGTYFNSLVETAYCCGCALFVRAAMIKEMGLMDERYFLLYEEADWCYRAKHRGFKCLFVPGAKVWHKVSAAFGGECAPWRIYYGVRNRLLWANQHLSFRQRALVWFKISVGIIREVLPKVVISKSPQFPVLKRLYWGICSALKECGIRCHNTELKAKVAGLRDGLLGRFGAQEATTNKLRFGNKG